MLFNYQVYIVFTYDNIWKVTPTLAGGQLLSKKLGQNTPKIHVS